MAVRAPPVEEGTDKAPRARSCAPAHSHILVQLGPSGKEPRDPVELTSMSVHRNPQAEQMADESMVRNLAAQAQSIWPQEGAFLERYGLRGPIRIADIGCGSGEITSRLALHYPQSEAIGIDILESSVSYARQQHAGLGARVKFEQGDAFHLTLPDNTYDLVVCRHMTQAIPEPDRVLKEMHRICKPGGWLHVLSEDYGMLHMPHGRLDPDELWHDGAIAYARATHTDARIGRSTWALMHRLGLADLRVDYVVVDTIRVPRATFAAIITAWRDGYTDAIGKHGMLGADKVRELFNYAIETILDADQYAVWHVPIVSGRKR
jgi:ubiquinone/menaquinone biosynthesis C-methylase UbiE